MKTPNKQKRIIEMPLSNIGNNSYTKEEVDKLNSADQIIFQTENQLKDFGDKLSDEKQIALSTEFLERNLTDIREVKNLTNEELARIGKAYFISQLDK